MCLTFEKHGLSVKEGEGAEEGEGGVVRLRHRNVCKDGFGEDLEETEEVDAVFLDLPAPWEAVPWATKVMRVCQPSIHPLREIDIPIRRFLERSRVQDMLFQSVYRAGH